MRALTQFCPCTNDDPDLPEGVFMDAARLDLQAVCTLHKNLPMEEEIVLLSSSYDEEESYTSIKSAALREVKQQLQLAGPLIAANLLRKWMQVISLMFVGHLGSLPLSGASVATSIIHVTGFSLLMGMASALETLCGQSNGAKQYHVLGTHLQTAMFVLSTVCVPIALLWAFTAQILMAAGQDICISKEAGIYTKWSIPTLFSYGLIQCQIRFLQAQNIVLPTMLSTGFCALLHVFICWSLVFKSELGYRGAALANSISFWINALILSAYVKFSPACTKTWTGFSMPSLENITSFLGLAIPSASMLCIEWWSFELLILMSGLLPNPQLQTSVLSILLNTDTIVLMISAGFGGAVSTRVSNELGAGNPQAARLAAYVVLLIVVIEVVVIGITIILIRHVWAYAYSNDREVIEYVSDMMPLLAIAVSMDAMQCVLSGIARACGWQKFGALVNFGAYYIVGIPTAAVLAFLFHLGGEGLWIGIICGLFTQMALLLCFTVCANWEKEAKKMKEKVQDLSS